jgi:hypothetical protein
MSDYPLVCKDNFLLNPHKIVELANEVDYFPTNGSWPGKRSNHLSKINENFFTQLSRQILRNYYSFFTHYCDLDIWFQKIKPYHEDKYDLKNRGWVHKDDCLFGGIIYLDEEEEEDTGTSMYDLDNLFFDYPKSFDDTKERLYLNDSTLSDDEYYYCYEKYHSQFKETIRINNKFNRLCSFSGNQFHALQTIGSKERLTMVFFMKHLVIDGLELYHSRRIF